MGKLKTACLSKPSKLRKREDSAAEAAAAVPADGENLQLPHAPRLARASLTLIEERVEALEQHKLAPPEEKQPVKPLKALLRNSYVLAIMAAIVAIIVVAKGRITAPEPLAHVHATDGVRPFTLPLDDTSVSYLWVNIVIAPYYPPNSTDGGHRRRRQLLAWAAEAAATASQPSSSGASSSSAAPLAGEEAVEVGRGMRKLLASPKLTLPTSASGRDRSQRRSLLTDAALDEPANEGPADLPQLRVTLMQRNTTSEVETFVPVSESEFCATKEAAAVRCALSITDGDLTSAYDPSQPLYLGFEATQLTQLVFRVEASDIGWLGYAKNWMALGILLVVLIGIASERIHRMWCAMIGAGAMMGLLLWMSMPPSLALVVEWIDESTLALLFGMMIIVGRLKDTGMFEVMSAAAVRWSRGKMWALSLMLMLITAFLSAWLDNVTTMLLIAPVSISVMRTCNRDPIPILMAQVFMSNLGGAATMVGDPPALIIGTALSAYIGFVDFIINMAPGVLMGIAVCVPLILWYYRRTLMGAIPSYATVLDEVKGFRITDWSLMSKSSYVTAVVLIGFLLHPIHHVDPAWFAVLGAIVLCVCDQPMEVENVVHSVEWDLLLFFAGMFAMIEASVEIGMVGMIAGWLESAIASAPEGSRLIVAIQILLWVSACISGILDNIPYTIVMVPIIEYLASAGLGLELSTLAWALNFGACLGGNWTLVGASANLVTATLAERAGLRITFVSWLIPGTIVVLASVAMADVWLLLRFCL